MKTKLSIFLSVFSLVCFSQTINTPTIPAGGAEFALRTITGTSASVAIVSTVQVSGAWNFSAAVTATSSNFNLKPVSASPSGSLFPLASHVRRIGTNEEAYVGYNGNQYTFHGNPQGMLGGPQKRYSTPLIMHVFPITPNQVPYTHTGTGTFQAGPFTVTRTDIINVTWLASGSLTMPTGESYPNAVLLKVLRTNSDNNPQDPNGPYVSTIDMYHWWVDGYPVPLVETRVYTPPPNQGQIQYSSTFRTPQSEINVQGNNSDIITNSTITNTLNSTDFGSTIIGNVITKTFKIENKDLGKLTISNMSLTGTSFSLVGLPSFPINLAGNSSVSFTVAFKPNLVGPNLGLITINNTDADESVYSFIISGTGLLDVSLNNINLEKELVNVFPSPTNDILNVNAPVGSSIKISDINGKVIKLLSIEMINTSINISDCEKGIYFVEVKTSHGLNTVKIIKD